jgi:predicted metal-binding membrane protein
MATAPVRLGTRIERGQIALIALLLLLAAVGWAVTDDRMEGMDAGPGTDLGTLGFYVTAWVVMMAAMMFPSIAPMVIVYARVQQSRAERGRAALPRGIFLFVGGYLLAWTGFGLAAYALFDIIHSLDVDALSWDRAGQYLAGGVVLTAAVYQLTPAKDVCLRHCRNPLTFVIGHWREGYVGSLRMGLSHGAWCVGCCWALMAALFALGVMSLGWMVFVAALIAVEKLLPWKAVANRGVALLLLVVGIAVIATPDRVPGLTLPNSPEARGAMSRMDGGSMSGGEMNEDSSKSGSTRERSMGDDPMGGR